MQVKDRKHIYLVYIKRDDFCTLEGLRLLCIGNDIRMNITIPCYMNGKKMPYDTKVKVHHKAFLCKWGGGVQIYEIRNKYFCEVFVCIGLEAS